MPGSIDPVDRKATTKEWLEQILNARIRPRIYGIKIHVVTIADNHVVYILEIPKGETAHQADDRKYYLWHNFTMRQCMTLRYAMLWAGKKRLKSKFILTLEESPTY